MASINYAQHIQNTILTEPEKFAKIVADYFILFKPKDIVSGDFYWSESIYIQGYWSHIIVVADCTGHGVPGAFMSMIGYGILNEIVLRRKIVAPDMILNALHRGIMQSLRQEHSGNNDGMDISICTLYCKDYPDYHKDRPCTLEFAGAKQSLVYFEDSEMNVISGNNLPIGHTFPGYKNNFYTRHTIEIEMEKEYHFYMFSDGFADQFGGSKGKKYLKPRFRKLLKEVQNEKGFEQQKNTLEKTLKVWKGEHEQVDDILVLGFKV